MRTLTRRRLDPAVAAGAVYRPRGRRRLQNDESAPTNGGRCPARRTRALQGRYESGEEDCLLERLTGEGVTVSCDSDVAAD